MCESVDGSGPMDCIGVCGYMVIRGLYLCVRIDVYWWSAFVCVDRCGLVVCVC